LSGRGRPLRLAPGRGMGQSGGPSRVEARAGPCPGSVASRRAPPGIGGPEPNPPPRGRGAPNRRKPDRSRGELGGDYRGGYLRGGRLLPSNGRARLWPPGAAPGGCFKGVQPRGMPPAWPGRPQTPLSRGLGKEPGSQAAPPAPFSTEPRGLGKDGSRGPTHGPPPPDPEGARKTSISISGV
jgi:hypothetical protein